MTQHRYQFDTALTPYAARNALGIANWAFLDNGSGQIPLPPSDITLQAGTGITLAVTGQIVTISTGAMERIERLEAEIDQLKAAMKGQ